MKRFLLLSALFLTLFPVCDLSAQKIISNSKVTGICYAGNKINRIYIPPPERARIRKSYGGGGKISVIYSGFTTAAENAVEYAVGILESILPSDLKMTVRASWTKISDTGILGNSSITSFAAGWSINAYRPMVYYPVTVAEKIADRSINENDEADVELQLNSSINWYTGTDGNTPVNKYDLVTVVLHELCHGLGFFDSMNVSNSLGYYGVNNLPVIYDTFVEDVNGRKLTDTTVYQQNSASLYSALTSGQVFFDGPLSVKVLAGTRPRLYAPSTWDEGSSISHLDELRTSQENSLMTPFIDLGEAIHDPGKLTVSMLGDIGWINTRIVPAEIKDTEEHLATIDVPVTVKSDTSYDKNNIGIVYSWDGFKTSDTLLMTPFSGANSFKSTLSVPGYNSGLSYYFYVTDTFRRKYNSPSLAEKSPYAVYIGTDTVKPVITHTQNNYYFELVDSVAFEAGVTDNLGVDTVYIEYSVDNEPVKSFGLKSAGGDKYSTVIDVKPWMLKGGDSVTYNIVAVDKAYGQNKKILPATGHFVIKIESLLPVVRNYSTDFSNAAGDFFNSGFMIEQPSGFGSLSLNSQHPYQSPDKDGMSLNFSSVLKHPFKYDASGIVLSYRELVLVEPGEEGSLFGFSDFYDYVIVEGSKDFGRSWFPLADGYDSRIYSSWNSAYNSSFDGQNSTYAGTESMMLTHNIYPKISDKISDGDSLLIRFRLYSDPYAHGWGWIIDDLKIGPLVDQTEEILTTPVIIYPNPGDGNLIISMDGMPDPDKISISVCNSSGQVVVKGIRCTGSQMNLDISNNPAGIYFIMIKGSDGTRTLKYVLLK